MTYISYGTRKYNGLSRDELAFLESKKQKEGKTYSEAKKETKKANGFVIRNGIMKAIETEKYNETHVEENFKKAFEELRKGGKHK